MPQFSPGVRRVAAILNFMADHPDQAFSVSDLVRALRISRATCHTILATLVDEGLLYRANDKTYLLGPTLAHIGKIAVQHASPLQVAQPEMRALADEFNTICLASFLEGHELIVRERTASRAHVGWPDPKGTRMHLRPPFGGVLFAWSSPAEVDAWLSSLAPPASYENVDILLKTMAFARDHGFTCVVQNAHFPGMHWATEQHFTEDRLDYPVTQVTELVADRDYPLVHMVAPIFDGRRRVAFILALHGFDVTATGVQVEQIGRRLREACDRISAYITRP